MVINKEVSTRINESARLLRLAIENLQAEKTESALSYSRQAITNSESAFFDPSLLELLYFPQDQKFAIYIPLFLPVAAPILKGAFPALKEQFGYIFDNFDVWV